jgi:hypothetical protein
MGRNARFPETYKPFERALRVDSFCVFVDLTIFRPTTTSTPAQRLRRLQAQMLIELDYNCQYTSNVEEKVNGL